VTKNFALEKKRMYSINTMEITKAQWASEGEHLTLSMPLSKIDKENRIVSGWASLDNADTQGDVILSEANKRAFSRFRGNIREMHQPIAVGKMVSFKEDSFYDPESEKFYNGIFVDVYVSKGAESTWEKVLDGTLQGFSIGGAIVDSETQFVKDAGSDGKSIRFVKDYDLTELSLVDSPANQLANIFSITKAADGSSIIKGMVAEAKSENVFYCKADTTAKSSTEETLDCGFCGTPMKNIGWYEYENDAEKVTKVADVVRTFNKKQETAPEEGGVNVADEKTPEETVDAGSTTVVESPVVEEGKDAADEANSVEAVTEAADEEEAGKVEKAADVSEVDVEVEDPDFTKMFDDLKSAIEKGLTNNQKAAEEAISKAVDTFNEKVGELVKKHDELTEKFSSLKTEVENVEKALSAVESETAVRKSGDLGGSTGETLQKNRRDSIWGGSILRSTDL
jgi:hypothetical protein